MSSNLHSLIRALIIALVNGSFNKYRDAVSLVDVKNDTTNVQLVANPYQIIFD